MNKKNIIIILVILILIILISSYFFLYFRREGIELREEVYFDDSIIIESFLLNPVISGSFVEMDFRNNVLYFETYDPEQRQDIISSVQITDKTVFKKKRKENEDRLIFQSHSQAFDSLFQGVPLRIFVEDISVENPEALLVKIDTDFSLLFGPAIMESL